MVAVLAEDGSGGAALHFIDPATSAITSVAAFSVSKSAALSCGAQLVWVLDDQNGAASDVAYGVSSGSAAVQRSIDLGTGFAAQSVLYLNEVLWFGGLGSPNLVSYDATGAPGTSVNLSSLADADGNPEVTALLMAEGGMVAVLRRENTSAGNFEASMVAQIDMATGTISQSGALEGRNAGRVATGMPGGLAIDMRRFATDEGGIERFDLATNASLGRSVEYGPGERVGTATTGSDGTIWAAVKTDGVTTVHHYVHDGTELDTGFTVTASGDLFAASRGGIFVGVDSTIVPYSDTNGAAGTPLNVGGKVLAVHACTPPSKPVDTGDTAAAP